MARTNLAIRPSVKNSATNWFGAVGWARITGAHASLPRSTAFAGTTFPSDLQMDRGACVPGRWYVWSVSVRAVSPQPSLSANIDWYNGASTFLSTSSGPEYNVTGATTVRIVSGVGLAPAGAATCRPNLIGFVGEAQATALLIEEYTTEAAANAALAAHATPAYYFDGDGDGVGNTGAAYAWTGTNGSSVSTTTAGAVPTAAVPFAPMGITGLAHSSVRAAAAAVPFAPMRIATGLIVTATYDNQRGRVRLKAVGLGANVVRVVVWSRPLGTTRWSVVRGGRIAVVAGALQRPVDDYEYRGGSAMQYRVQALANPENTPDDIVQTKILTVDGIPDVFWLKFIASPYLNRRVRLHKFSDVERKSKNATFSVRGRSLPVQVTDVHDGREMSIQLVTKTVEEREGLDQALSLGAPVLFQSPVSHPAPTMYAVVGDYSWRPLSTQPGRFHALFTIPLAEADPPPPSIVGVGLTWAVLVQQYSTWQELTDNVSSWRELMA